MVVNIADLMPIDLFKSQVDQWIQTLKSTPLQQGFDEITLPGENALRTEADRRKHGIPVQPQYWAGIQAMASEVGIDLEALRD
jgi:LDH2 family malate/lactate/ureidoglycolate dehydrogenase